MEQDFIRTTIRLPRETHKALLQQAFKNKKSLNQVMLERMKGDGKGKNRLERFLEGEKKLAAIRKKYTRQKNRMSPADIIRQMRDGRAEELWKRSH